MRAISLKALLISNIAHLMIITVATIAVMAVGLAYLTVANDGSSSPHDLVQQVTGSGVVLTGVCLAEFVAAALAGYIAARVAKRAEILNGALSSSFMIALSICDAIWGPWGSDEQTAHVPAVLDFLASWGGPLFGMLGAYLSKARPRPAIA